MSLKSSAENVTMHGFGRITTSKSFVVRSLWLVLMLGFSSMCVYQLVTIISKYASNSSIIKEETIIAHEIDFPAVTICAPAFSKWKLLTFAEERNITVAASNEHLKSLGVDKYLYGFELLDREIVSLESLEKVVMSEDEFLLKKLKTCSFNEKKCNYTTDYEKLLVLYRSFCYKFNHHGRFKQRRAGAHSGFHIILFLNVSDTTPWSFIDVGDAVEVIIHNPSVYPFIESGTILGKAGHLSQIDIQKTEIQRLESPYPSNCTDGEDANILYPGKYTTLNCIESCIAYNGAKECSVAVFHSLPYMPNANESLRLAREEDLECYRRAFQRLIDSDFSSCSCSLSCHETIFQKSASYSQWPATADLPFYKTILSESLELNENNLSNEFVRRNFLKISVFFGDMTYRKITEVRQYPLDGLISDIGGQMGIWLGASMFSVIELLCLLGQFFQAICESRGKEKKKQTLESPSVRAD